MHHIGTCTMFVVHFDISIGYVMQMHAVSIPFFAVQPIRKKKKDKKRKHHPNTPSLSLISLRRICIDRYTRQSLHFSLFSTASFNTPVHRLHGSRRRRLLVSCPAQLVLIQATHVKGSAGATCQMDSNVQKSGSCFHANSMDQARKHCDRSSSMIHLASTDFPPPKPAKIHSSFFVLLSRHLRIVLVAESTGKYRVSREDFDCLETPLMRSIPFGHSNCRRSRSSD